jgi:hypothetical protein
MKVEVGVFSAKRLHSFTTTTQKVKFWTPQCSTCPKCMIYVDERGYVPCSRRSRRRGWPPFCLWGKEPRRLIHANLERNCLLMGRAPHFSKGSNNG